MLDTHDNEYQRRRVLLTLIVVTAAAAFFLAIVNIYHARYLLAGAQVGFGAYSLVLISLTRSYRSGL